jgi:AcrR family transcriptional regulator
MSKSADSQRQTPRLDPAAERRGQAEAKLERLLAVAAELMARQGFGQTSIRKVAQETGYSLAGMYYYFQNKEDLLYQIQHRTFSALLQQQEESLRTVEGGRNKLRCLIMNHLSHFTHHFNELKVCTFELASLQGERYSSIESLRRRYFTLTAQIMAELLNIEDRNAQTNRIVRHYSLFVFGMLNWIFMWYDPRRDAPAEELGEEMLAMVWRGLGGIAKH